MSQPGAAGLRALAFGTLDGSLWAAAIDPPSGGGGGSPALVIGGAGESGDGTAEGIADHPFGWRGGLTWSGPAGGAWTLSGAGVQLTVEPAARVEPAADEAGHAPGRAAATGEVQELCRVRGTVTLDGAQPSERALDCVGTRIAVEAAAMARLGSARLVSAWFADAEALTLLALRPEASADHDSDAVAATLFDPDGWLPVSDPRLSTTYDAAGAPTRANLELWVGEGENEFPRRAAGEVAGPGATVTAGPIALRVVPLGCHSRGQEGSGVYVLATF